MAQCTLIIIPVSVNGNVVGTTDEPYGYGQHNFIDIANWGVQVPVHATALSGYRFAYFEISGPETGNFFDNPHNFTILPGAVYTVYVHFEFIPVSDGQIDYTIPILIIAGVAVAGIVGYLLYKRRRR